MFLTKTEAFQYARIGAGPYRFDPLLIMALMEQESGFDTEAVRLENNFFRRYERPLRIATTSKVLRATSFGLCQLMGESLAELGYFDPPMYATPEGVVKRINLYMVDPQDQVNSGARWLRYKMDLVKTQDVSRGLALYNGSGEYPYKVFARMERLQKEHEKGLF